MVLLERASGCQSLRGVDRCWVWGTEEGSSGPREHGGWGIPWEWDSLGVSQDVSQKPWTQGQREPKRQEV